MSGTKQAPLAALAAADGGFISGQQLAAGRGVSRAAVHKAAEALKAQGYAIEAVTRRGYRLAGGDAFCPAAVGSWPGPVYLYDSLPGTNRRAKELALAGAEAGALVLAAHQSEGRGRLGRRFESPAGKGVYCSYLLRPDAPVGSVGAAAAAAAIAPPAWGSTAPTCRAPTRLAGAAGP